MATSLRRVMALAIAEGLAALILCGCLSPTAIGSSAAASPEDRDTRSFVILAMNDVYRIEGLDGGAAGGVARVRTVRAELERAHPGRVLLLHGGDVIFPSFLSRDEKGEQMIDALNLLDGDPAPGRLDEHMFVVLGNHEFDREPACTAAPPGNPSILQQRIADSDFYWLDSNVVPSPCPGESRPRLLGANLLPSRIIEIGGLRVGLFGLTIATPGSSFEFLDARETARTLTRDLRRRGADVVVALTHLNWSDDVQLYDELRREGLDLIVGGHDHVKMSLPLGAREPRIFKSDSDARTVWEITVTRHAGGRLEVAGVSHRLDERVPKDPVVDRMVTRRLAEHAARFCERAAHDPGWLGAKPVTATCLDERLAVAATELDAAEDKIRSRETSMGNWIADRMFAAFEDCHVDGAFINAGGLRLNQDIARGSAITMRQLEELVEYPTSLHVYRLSHAKFRQALENAVSVPDAGRWLQVSDQIAFVYRPADEGRPARLLKAVIRRGPGVLPTEITDSSTGELRIVANEFLQKSSVDGFDRILPPPDDASCPAAGSDLKRILYTALKTLGRIGSEERPGRICTEAEAEGHRQVCLATASTTAR
jgi:5'-nucleotidase